MNLFIEDTIKGINITENKAKSSQSINWFNNLSEHHDSEIKIYKSDIKNYKASFNWKNINTWKIDIPVQLNKVHKQCYATKEQCIPILKELYEKGHIDEVPGFIDVPIRHFNLDDMLQFQKEDKMMLKGEDPDQDDHIAIEENAPQSKTTQKAPVKKLNTASPEKKDLTLKDVSPKKTPPKTSITLGENLKTNSPKTAFKKTKPKIAKEKPKDDNSFFQI